MRVKNVKVDIDGLSFAEHASFNYSGQVYIYFG